MTANGTAANGTPAFTDLEVGQEIGTRQITVTRADLVRYAGASGDRNPIHWNNDFAESVGLPGVIAHGMFTMGAASALVTDWAGDPGRVLGYSTRFSKPVPVADTTGQTAADGSDVPGAVLTVSGKVGVLDDAAQTARIDLTVSIDGAEGKTVKVLMKTLATVDLSERAESPQQRHDSQEPGA